MWDILILQPIGTGSLVAAQPPLASPAEVPSAVPAADCQAASSQMMAELAPPEPGDEYWAARFDLSEMNGPVHAAVEDGAGNLYIGGEFRQIGAVTQTCTRWTASHGPRWTPAWMHPCTPWP